MGLGADVIELLAWLKHQKQIETSGKVVEIGAQQLADSFLEAGNELNALGHDFGQATPFTGLRQLATPRVPGTLEYLSATAPPAREFWRWLGYSYAAIDIDGSPGSIPLDLNYDSVPRAHRGKYQIVTNFGTTEHVANQLNAFKVIHDLAAHHGVMIHHLPTQGMFCHGLVNYNLKFFWMLARSNGYKVLWQNYRSDGKPSPLPEDILEHVNASDSHARQRLADYRGRDCAIVVILKKQFDIDYVAPLDVPTGASVTDPLLKQRYWTVFMPDAFQSVPRRETGVRRLASSLVRSARGAVRKLRST